MQCTHTKFVIKKGFEFVLNNQAKKATAARSPAPTTPCPILACIRTAAPVNVATLALAAAVDGTNTLGWTLVDGEVGATNVVAADVGGGIGTSPTLAVVMVGTGAVPVSGAGGG